MVYGEDAEAQRTKTFYCSLLTLEEPLFTMSTFEGLPL